MPHFLRPLVLIGIAIGLCAACTPAARQPQYADPNLIFLDDFSDTTSGWNRYSGAEGSTSYDNGQYLVVATQPQRDLWGLPGLDVADVTVEVDTAYAAGPVNNEYGLICRHTHSNDKNSFYFFFISGDGYYVTGKVVQNTLTYLQPKDFQSTETVRQEKTATNRVTATCQGTKMSFAVNGTTLSSFEDSELTHGDIGLIAGALDEGGVKIHFDNLTARKP